MTRLRTLQARVQRIEQRVGAAPPWQIRAEVCVALNGRAIDARRHADELLERALEVADALPFVPGDLPDRQRRIDRLFARADALLDVARRLGGAP